MSRIPSVNPGNACIPLAGFSIADLVPGPWFETYEKEIEDLHNQVVQVQTNIRILDHVLAFPFEIVEVDPHPFWTTTSRALFDSTIMGLWRLLLDDHKDALTLRRLRNDTLEHMPDPEKRRALKRAITERLGDRSADIEHRLRMIRHEFLAHRSKARVSSKDALGHDAIVALEELCEIKQFAVGLLASLSFERGRSVDYFEYSDAVTPRRQTDIEIILDLLVKGGNWLNLPERDPAWPMFKARMSPEERELFRGYRAKFGMCEDPE